MGVVTRRALLRAGAAGAVLPRLAVASSRTPTVASIVGDAAINETRLALSIPLIAETGSAVPLSLALPGEAVQRWVVIAEKNPKPMVLDLNVGALAAQSTFTTRVRLGATQTVQAFAQTRAGTWHSASATVALTGSACYDGT